MTLIDSDHIAESYVGRFAPSPTGPLHFGSLVGALASYLDARAHQGQWLVRIEDIDPLREPPGAADKILRTLEAHHLHWNAQPLFQSTRTEAYEAAISQLMQSGNAYRCPCSRKQLAENHGLHLFACREKQFPGLTDCAIRFMVEDERIELMDQIQGRLDFQLHSGRDDFVLKRKEGFYAYQLAVVVDDAWQRISHVVRGSDLVDSIPFQLLLQCALNLPQPRYAHFPVITNATGQKLSKQNLSPALDDQQASANIQRALNALSMPVPSELHQAPPDELLSWAVSHWSLQQIPAVMSIPETSASIRPIPE